MNTKFSAERAAIKLYRHPLSGHCHRVELMISLLGLPYTTVDVDLMNGEQKQAEFLAMNPFGQVPVIDDNGTVLADANAIIIYLVKAYSEDDQWLSKDPVVEADVQRWLSIAAGEIAAGPAAARAAKLFGREIDYELAKTKAQALFATLEPYLGAQLFLVGNKVSLADIAGYSYISHVPEGGVSLAPYPNIRAWLKRIEALPRFVGMARSPEPNPQA